MGKTSEAQKRAIRKYMTDKCDRLELLLPKGKKAEIKRFAENNGESMTSFIIRLIDDAILREQQKNQTQAEPPRRKPQMRKAVKKQ